MTEALIAAAALVIGVIVGGGTTFWIETRRWKHDRAVQLARWEREDELRWLAEQREVFARVYSLAALERAALVVAKDGLTGGLRPGHLDLMSKTSSVYDEIGMAVFDVAIFGGDTSTRQAASALIQWTQATSAVIARVWQVAQAIADGQPPTPDDVRLLIEDVDRQAESWPKLGERYIDAVRRKLRIPTDGE